MARDRAVEGIASAHEGIGSRDVMWKVGKVSRFSEIGANLGHIVFIGVTLGVTFKVIKGKMPVYM